MKEENKNYLGIDWGSASVGVALAHAETLLAMSYATLQNDKDLVLRLGEIIASEEVGTVVIGIPTYINREAGEYPGETFGKALAEKLPIRIEYQNEMFTTKIAQANLIERGMKHVSNHDDEESARIILQEWLDRQKK